MATVRRTFLIGLATGLITSHPVGLLGGDLTLGLTGGLDFHDVTALRFAVSGLVLAPVPSSVLLFTAALGWMCSASVSTATGVVALVLFMRAVALLGAGRAALFAAIVPAMGAVLAVPVLDEELTLSTLGGALLVSVSMVLAVGRGAVGPRRAAATAGQIGGLVPKLQASGGCAATPRSRGQDLIYSMRR
jgi:drug/metabolite transporter (DMT)-like permease